MTQICYKSAVLFLANICCYSWLSEVPCAVERSSTRILNNDLPPPQPCEVDANVGLPAVDLGEGERRDVAPDFQRLSEDTPDLLLAHLPGEPHDPAREQRRCQNTQAGGGLAVIPSDSLAKHHIMLSPYPVG